jgi:hypothetical protein
VIDNRMLAQYCAVRTLHLKLYERFAGYLVAPKVRNLKDLNRKSILETSIQSLPPLTSNACLQKTCRPNIRVPSDSSSPDIATLDSFHLLERLLIASSYRIRISDWREGVEDVGAI